MQNVIKLSTSPKLWREWGLVCSSVWIDVSPIWNGYLVGPCDLQSWSSQSVQLFFTKHSPKVINPVVKELQDHLLMRGYSGWGESSTQPLPDEFCLWANRDQMRHWRSLVFPRSCPCRRFSHSLGWVRTLTWPLQLLKMGRSTNPPLAIVLQKGMG